MAFSIAEGGQSSQHSNILAGLRWPTVERQRFWLTLFNTEDKRRNGDSMDITFVLLIGLIMKTYLCPKSELNYLGLSPDNGVAVATFVQKVGLITLGFSLTTVLL